MKIAFNLLGLWGHQAHSVYARHLLKRFMDMVGSGDVEIFPIAKNFQPTSAFFAMLYVQLVLPMRLLFQKADIVFSPSPIFPLLLGKKNVVVIHDLAYRRFPSEAKLGARLIMCWIYAVAKRLTKLIITVSEFSKKELIELYCVPEENIAVIHEGPPLLPTISDKFIRKTLGKFNIRQPYFLYVGVTRPRKNLERLLEAFTRFSREYSDFQLVLVGKVDKRFLDICMIAQRLGILKRIVQTDFVGDEEKAALYFASTALTFPSLYEGFGLPVLEAQSLGVPVLTSNTSSLPEVAGDAVVYVNPYDVEDIANGMKKIAFDENLREELIRKGFENIKRFSWEKAARQLLEIFREVYENPSSE